MNSRKNPLLRDKGSLLTFRGLQNNVDLQKQRHPSKTDAQSLFAIPFHYLKPALYISLQL